MEPTVAEVAEATLPPGTLADAWQHYVTVWYAGRRAEALTALTDFVNDLTTGPPAARDVFARWLCGLLFDRSQFWSGQWGGGMDARDGTTYERPAVPALTTHPLSAEIVLPYLMAAPSDPHSPHLRWLYKFTVGQRYRLPPEAQSRLDTAVRDRIGPDVPLTELLRHATGDLAARRMLRDAEAD